MANYWLMKSEPFKYSWDDLVAEEEGTWDGVRNYSARLNLRAMKVGDEAFFYHSREGLEIVGIVTISVDVVEMKKCEECVYACNYNNIYNM